ncbi:MAG: hypothetical protein CFH06_00836 [Alphaproteobacteria bacterium MarineAlpha3_Bin5]|nr:MAG: hypothetical protein CFH06_00836 [Alphaproteobacteria bacterium MarineAlpha3_Bin5]
MRTLYHLWLSPFCRKIRIVLEEKQIKFQLKAEGVWNRRKEFLAINPAGEVPVLIEPDGTALSGSSVIFEYLEEIGGDPTLLGKNSMQRAETRRLVDWFDRKFNLEVTEKLVGEKFIKRFLEIGEPNSESVRAGHNNIHIHLDYINYLIERRHWLAGDIMTIADLAAAAHLSTIDYIGSVPWSDHEIAKNWYARIKSRPSFRKILKDRIPGAPPPKNYSDLDF